MAYNNSQTMLGRLGLGVLNGYLSAREQRRADSKIADERAYEQQNIQSSRDFQTQQQQASYGRQDEVYERQKTDQGVASNREFLERVATAAAGAGSLTPEIVAELGPDIDAQTLKLLQSLSGTVAIDKDAKTKLDSQKAAGKVDGPKPVDMSLLRADVKAVTGFDPSPGDFQKIASFMQAYPGVPANIAVQAVFPDQSTMERPKDGAGSLGNEADVMRDLESTRPDMVKNATTIGVPVMSVVDRIVKYNESPEDAFRHATADKYSETISQQLQIAPDQQVDMSAINGMLQQMGLQPIPGSPQRALTDLVDEMISRNVGAGGKKPQLETIMAIIQNALMPQQSQQRTQGSSVGRSIMNTVADFTPGIKRQDFKFNQPGGMASPFSQNRSVQGNRRP